MADWLTALINGISSGLLTGKNYRDPAGFAADVGNTALYGNSIPGTPHPSQDLIDYGERRKMGSIGSGISDLGPSTTDQILQQLQALQDPSRYAMDNNSLMKQAMLSASMQYDPLISEIQNDMSQSETRANRNKDVLGSMFNQLGDSLAADVPKIQQQYTDTSNQVGQNYQNLQNTIKDTYAQTQADQEALYKRLNIQAAAPDVLPQQQRDADYFQNMAAQTNQTQQNALQQEKQGAVDYAQQGSISARREGTQRQADLMSQLQDLLTGYQNKIGEYKAAKNSAYLKNLGDLQTSSQKDARDRAQQDFTNYIASINLGRGLQSDALEQLKYQNSLGQQTTKSLADVPGRAASLGLNSGSSQRVTDVMNSALLNDMVSGASTGQNLSPEARVSQIIRLGQQQGLSPQELNALQNIALEYFGRR